MATLARFRQLALACDGAVQGGHHDVVDFRCNGRIFASLNPDGKRAMVKLTPAQQRERKQVLGDAIVPASGAWGERGYTLVTVAAVDVRTITDLVTDAWQNVMQATTKPSGRSKAATEKRAAKTKKAAKK